MTLHAKSFSGGDEASGERANSCRALVTPPDG